MPASKKQSKRKPKKGAKTPKEPTATISSTPALPELPENANECDESSNSDTELVIIPCCKENADFYKCMLAENLRKFQEQLNRSPMTSPAKPEHKDVPEDSESVVSDTELVIVPCCKENVEYYEHQLAENLRKFRDQFEPSPKIPSTVAEAHEAAQAALLPSDDDHSIASSHTEPAVDTPESDASTKISDSPFDDPNLPLDIPEILATFATCSVWIDFHYRCFELNNLNHHAMSVRLHEVMNLIDQKAPIVAERKAIFSQLTGVPASRYTEWLQWDTYIINLNRLIPSMNRHLEWINLHTRVHKSMQPVFLDFWKTLNSRREFEAGGGQLDDEQLVAWNMQMRGILDCLTGWNRKRLFLSGKMKEADGWKGVVWAEPPVWTEWD